MNKLREAAVVRTRYQRQTPAAPSTMIDWTVAQPGLWVGRIGLDFAGLVELGADGYVVTDWRGEKLGTHAALEDAQLSLEPAQRSLQRDLQERAAARTNALLSCALVVGTLTVAGAVGAWLAQSA
ncbi:hypothetical protein [Herbiconiux sp. L3-i23]|uniref:hypothetical protein n=1 Tax=Herbiconiux sp. L3-i23 TaxID=2905871 RepID=UPI00205A58D1|nr:hypothetical protein [Herbiconiux sp. L3-i23]BDI21285.1 hypothetical protein L3i23_00610 [Herbiconiux sp. L3-i23]